MASNNARNHRMGRLIAVLAILLVLCCADAAWACPTCKENLSNSPNGSNLVQGYFWSICFMMSMPFLILGGLGAYFYLEVRKARAQLPPSGEIAAATPGALDTSS